MGGKSSKVGTYVLTVAEEKPEEALSPYRHKPGSSKKLSSPGNDSPVSPVSPIMSPSQSSSQLQKSKSSAVLDRRKSSSTMLIKDASTKQMSKKQLDKMNSSNDLSQKRRGSIASSSSQYPWIMKQGKLPPNSTLKDMEFGRILGQGFMGTVRIVKTKNDKYIVMKCVKKEAVMKKKSNRHILSEKNVLNTINNVFCIKLFGTFQDKSYLYFALEFAAGGELCHHLDNKQFFDPEVAKFYISEIFVALEHVQSLGFVYRDLKPENVMLDEDGHCKLVDFGFTTTVNDHTGKLHTMCGTACYLSPEQLDGKFTNGYTHIVDWWSFGVLIYELRTGATPFCRSRNDTNYEIFLRILKKKISFPFNFDKKSKELISSLCYADVNKRLCDPEHIKKHSYFELPWTAVQERRLVPPIVPALLQPGDTRYFKQHPDLEGIAPFAAHGSGATANGSAASGGGPNSPNNAPNLEYRSEFFDF